MKNFSIIIILSLLLSTFTMLQAQANYEQYSIENAKVYCPSPDEKSIYVVETIKKQPTIVKRDIATGEVIKQYKNELPKADFDAMTISNSEKTIYLASSQKVEGSQMPKLAQLYSAKLEKGTVKELLEDVPDFGFITNMVKMDEGLLIRPFRGSATILDTKKGIFTPIIEDKEYRLIFAAPEKNGAIFGKMDDEEKLVDLYFADFSKKMTLTKVGKYQPDLRVSTETGENEVPHFILEDKNKWIDESYNKNRYPSMVMQLADNAEVMDYYANLNNSFEISTISVINNNWLIGNKYSRKSISVFNVKEPKLKKTPTVNAKDIAAIDKLLENRYTIGGKALDHEEMELIFSAKFFNLEVTTQEEDYQSSSYYLAYNFGGEFKVLENKAGLLPLMNKDYTINEKSAVQFENVLDVLFPLGHFEKDDKENFRKGNQWIFVRDESFGEKSGIVVDFDANGKLTKIDEQSNIQQ